MSNSRKSRRRGRNRPRDRSAHDRPGGSRLGMGLVWGIGLAFGFSAFLALGALIAGSARLLSPGASLVFGNLPIARLAIGYLLGSALSGLLFGLLWPRATSAMRSICVGTAAAVPFVLMVRFAVVGTSAWTGWDVLRLAVSAAVWGGTFAILLRRIGLRALR